METSKRGKPGFFIIGAQKSGTSWLWTMLEQHPGTSLPATKEIQYFGSAKIYAKGDDWYFKHFEGLDTNKVIGEASTTYFYDRIPYFYNKSDQIEFDDSLPRLPKLIAKKFPDAKYIVALRDPVRRAISAYSHWMKRANNMKNLSPTVGLKKQPPNIRKCVFLNTDFMQYISMYGKNTYRQNDFVLFSLKIRS